MKYAVIFEEERPAKTISALEKSYSNKEDIDKVNCADCTIYLRGNYWVIEHKQKVLYYEANNINYPFFENAIHDFDIEKRKEWKTVRNLISFRSALTEDGVSLNSFTEILTEPLTKDNFKEFMKLARAADLMHHGRYTF